MNYYDYNSLRKIRLLSAQGEVCKRVLNEKDELRYKHVTTNESSGREGVYAKLNRVSLVPLFNTNYL